MALKMQGLIICFILCISIVSAAPENGYKITYTIDVKEDGTATWNVEYRTLLSTKEDFNSFNNYTRQLQSANLDDFKALMQKSVSEAAAATSRGMIARDFTADAAVQSTPSGAYGVVHYSFQWTNFAKINSNMNIGDVFIGGLYLSKDDTLIIQYPQTYMVEQVTPQPDQIREGLIWYGLRSFGAGEPRLVLVKTGMPWMQSLVAAFVIFAVLGAFIYLRKTRKEKENTEEIKESISETEIIDLEERIIKLLKENGNALYQSEIGRKLNLPKSTVSSALNGLYNKNIIQKIKKGRENLIRLI
ncbi:Uncharacterised protein [uncultured archaeon]|nr:Uncharacterised protein [uncultured archaeon]